MDTVAEARVLGKRVEYPKRYCPEILVAVPRSLNREAYGIAEGDGLFCGWDCWHAYEASFLLDSGLPVVGVLKLVYACDSRCIVESKSLKLYLGSYNMEALGRTREEATACFTRQVAEDLSRLLETEVRVGFHADGLLSPLPFDFEDYRVMEQHMEPQEIACTIYQECPALLSEGMRREAGEMRVASHLLKSNCKITGQPDWGSLYIRLKGNCLPDEKALLRYIVSLRNENHFHEEICEMTYKRLTDLFHPEVLVVSCLYTRRGGIDICPTRANRTEFLPPYLPQEHVLTGRNCRN